MAYVKGKGYVKTGYTAKQKEIADWITISRKDVRMHGTHVMLRTDKTLRNYALNPVAQVQSFWYAKVKRCAFSSGVTDLGGGTVEVRGNAGSGGHTRIYQSRFGIKIINTHRLGKKPKGANVVTTLN